MFSKSVIRGAFSLVQGQRLYLNFKDTFFQSNDSSVLASKQIAQRKSHHYTSSKMLGDQKMSLTTSWPI